MSIYSELLAAGVPLDNHESDLYAKLTPDSSRIVEHYRAGDSKCATVFRSPLDGSLWYDLPFMYTPFWDART